MHTYVLRAAWLIFGIAWATAVCSAQSNQCPPSPSPSLPAQCAIDNRSNPQPLSGYNATSGYCFEHVSVAAPMTNGGQRMYDYRYWLLNFETQNALDAEWLKAGLRFGSLAPTACAFVSFNSGVRPTEDSNAPVTFGRRKEFSKTAALHLPRLQQSAIRTLELRPAQSYPSLTSRFYATVVTPDSPGRRITIDISTRSEFKSDQVFLQVSNAGDSDLLYSVPALAEAAGNRWNMAVEKSMWKRSAADAEKFSLAGGGYANLLLEGVSQSSESVITIDILSPSNPRVILGQARISAYLPQAFGSGAR